MVRAFQALVAKEVKDLLKDRKIVVGMILVPLFLFPLMGEVISLSTQSASSSASSPSLALMNLDEGNYSSLAVSYFSALPGVTVTPIPPQQVEAAMQAAIEKNASTLVVIPSDFSARVADRQQASLETYTTVSKFGVGEATGSAAISSLVGSFSKQLSAYYIHEASSSLSPSVVLSPVVVNESTFFKGRLLQVSPSVVAAAGLGQMISLPLATFIVLIFAMQIASTAMAVEKEQRTLETLLTFPVSRFKILASKLIGSTVIAAIGAVTSIIGFTYYMSMSTEMIPTTTVEITPSLSFYVLLGLLLFLTLALATSVAIVVSVFASDVRGAQAVVSYVALPMILPTFAVVFGDVNTFPLGLKVAILAIPFSYVAIFASTGFMGDLTYALVGIVYLSAWVLATLYFASRLFNSERIITAGFSLRRRRTKGPAEEG